MKKKMQFLATVFLTITLLVACNTAENQTTNEPASDQTTANAKENTNSKNDLDTNEEQQNTPTDASDSQKETPTANTLTYTSNGSEITKETSQVTSDQQDYSIQIIPGFTLTAEEPGKDLLYFEENDRISMRIEKTTKDQTTFEDLVGNTEETMTAIGEYENFALDEYLNDNKVLINSTAFIANIEAERVIMVVFETEESFARLTIYDDETEDLKEALIKMGLTVR